MTPLEQTIVDIVESSQGIKAVELAIKVGSKHLEESNISIHHAFERLVERGDIYEIEYELPIMQYRIKSFFLPKGTEIRVTKIEKRNDGTNPSS